MSLSSEERVRYARQLLLWGEEGQQKLREARVLVLGAGGLGSSVIPYLAAAGVGAIGVVDDDGVELSNLHRQIMHDTEAVGVPKVISAAVAAARINPNVRVIRHLERFTDATAPALLRGYDLVVDGFDAFVSRFAASDAAAAAGIPHVWGSVLGYDGQVSVFDARRGLTLRTLFPSVPADADADSCSTVGVLGPVCAAIGGVMAGEALKLLTGTGTPLLGRVAIYDALDATWREIALEAGPVAAVETPERPEIPLGTKPRLIRSERPVVPGIDVRTLKADIAEGASSVIIDLREEDEVAVDPPIEGAVRLPFSQVMRGARPDDALKDEELVIYCAHGVRSGIVGPILLGEGWHVAHIEGGLERYRQV